MRRFSLLLGLAVLAGLAGAAFAADAQVAPAPAGTTAAAAPKIDTGDTAWVLVSAALVLLMTPALAFFYGGLVRRKNVLSIMMQCFIIVCIVTLQWVLCGYSFAFGPTVKGYIGDLSWAGLAGVGAAPNTDYAPTVPHQAFMSFQLMFAIITPALIIGAFAERMRFLGFTIFMVLWATLVYDPVAHWVWGAGGWLKRMGALDFAGGIVVHINAGVAALVCALVLGKRVGYPDKISPPHNLPFAVLGAGMLWFGWFGFNAGSALGANGLAAGALVATHVGGAAGALTWALLDVFVNRRMTVLGIITGAVAGLAAITPGSGFVTPLGAIGIGVGASVICYVFVMVIKTRLGYDDSLDAFGVHGVGGVWGTIATGLWATKSVNPAGADGLFYGSFKQLGIQAVAAGVTVVYSLVLTVVLLIIVNKIFGIRVNETSERIGLDLTEHRETGYTMLD